MSKFFPKLKKNLIVTSILKIYYINLPPHMFVDFLKIGVGVVLRQSDKNVFIYLFGLLFKSFDKLLLDMLLNESTYILALL